MKVYEKINQLKGTEASAEEIASWAYNNRICPLDFDDGLEEINEEYPEQLTFMAGECCSIHSCGTECLDDFLNAEYKEAE
jgi:hypothetical protein